MKHAASPEKSRDGKWIPAWFKVSVCILAVLALLKVLGLRIFVELSYDGVPWLVSLTDKGIYLALLGVLLIYILGAWLWDKFFGPRDL